MLLRNDKQPITGSVERGTRSPHGLKELAYMKRKSAGNKAHLQPVTHFFVHIGVSIARVVFQRSGTKFRYVTLVMLQAPKANGWKYKYVPNAWMILPNEAWPPIGDTKE